MWQYPKNGNNVFNKNVCKCHSIYKSNSRKYFVYCTWKNVVRHIKNFNCFSDARP